MGQITSLPSPRVLVQIMNQKSDYCQSGVKFKDQMSKVSNNFKKSFPPIVVPKNATISRNTIPKQVHCVDILICWFKMTPNHQVIVKRYPFLKQVVSSSISAMKSSLYLMEKTS